MYEHGVAGMQLYLRFYAQNQGLPHRRDAGMQVWHEFFFFPFL